jgi:hypothetical protein
MMSQPRQFDKIAKVKSIAAILGIVFCFYLSMTHAHSAKVPCLLEDYASQDASSDRAYEDTSSVSTTKLIECNTIEKQLSWVAWFMNRSDSTQLHYLDLLELLSRS